MVATVVVKTIKQLSEGCFIKKWMNRRPCQPGATWTEGRNRLLEVAVSSSLDMADGGYEYYVFMDDDIPAMADGDVNGRLMHGFEQFLNEKSPATAGGGRLRRNRNEHTTR